MAAIDVNQKVFEKLKQAYAERFGSSPRALITRLNRAYKDELQEADDALIADRTIRNFFNSNQLPRMQEKNLNYLCVVLLEIDSYREAERQLAQVEPDYNSDWFDPYWKHLESKCSTMKVLEMTESIPLEELYIKVNLIENVRSKKRKNLKELLTNLENDDYQDIRQFSFNRNQNKISGIEAVKKYRKLLVLGRPGAGKTTFLKYLALHLTTEDTEKKTIPFFLRLRDFVKEQSQSSLLEILIQEFTLRIPDTESIVHEWLEQGNCLILLDGLDEVTQAQSKRVYQEIDKLLQCYPENQYVMTCRTGASEYVFPDFTEVEVANFDKEQVAIFISNWFQDKGESDTGVRFLKKLADNPSVQELATNPLLLTILCWTFEDSYNLPKNRYALYTDAVDALLRRWDASRRIARDPIYGDKLSRQRKINMFSEIAYHGYSYQPPQYLWQKWELEQQIRQFIENIPGVEPETLEVDTMAVLRAIEYHHGLLVQQARDIYSFSHRTFQEYFTAEYIVESRETSIINRIVKEHLTQLHWQEIFILIAQRLASADEFLKLMFNYANLLVQSEALQTMLDWLDRVTTAAQVKSSAWRALYFAIDLDVELYIHISSDDKINRQIAEKLAIAMREFNIERKKTTPTQPRALLTLDLAATHALALEEAEERSSNKHTTPLRVSSWAQARLNVQEGTDIAQRLQQAIERAEKSGYTKLVEELVALQKRQPCDDASGVVCQQWAEDLQKIMLKHLDVGHGVIISKEDLKSLEDYIYVNYLILECIRGECYVSRNLREEIIDNLLMPSDRIPSHLLPALETSSLLNPI
ncbi:MAG: NACHT domain-containing protein [Symploca sp. SIO2B6]|nr:NACHT domain-containing protein [Symploca sp. SIO2B6]